MVREGPATLEIYRGDTLTLTYVQLGRLGDISTATNIWFTVKADKDHADSSAAIQIDQVTGLLYINGTAATVAANGSITTVDATTGSITVSLAAVETAKLSNVGSFSADVQWTDGTAVTTPFWYHCCITGDVTLVTS